jgi:hypothetical protein
MPTLQASPETSLHHLVDDCTEPWKPPTILLLHGNACPTLAITTEESGLASVAETRAWPQTIQGSELRPSRVHRVRCPI